MFLDEKTARIATITFDRPLTRGSYSNASGRGHQSAHRAIKS
jgi:hypothetical protein